MDGETNGRMQSIKMFLVQILFQLNLLCAFAFIIVINFCPYTDAILKPSRQRKSHELDLSGVPPPGAENLLRTCILCHEVMVKKLHMIEEKTSKTLFIMLYDVSYVYILCVFSMALWISRAWMIKVKPINRNCKCIHRVEAVKNRPIAI